MIGPTATLALCALLLNATEAPPVALGNGRLSAALTPRGITTLHRESTHSTDPLRWQRIGGPQDTPQPPPATATLWNADLPVFQASLTATQADPELGIIAFVHPTHDILAIQITLHTPDPDQHLRFESRLAPAARYPIAAEGLLPALQPQRGFAAFAAENAQRLYLFRPANAGRTRRALAAASTATAAKQWPRMEGGTWAAFASAEDTLDVQSDGKVLGPGTGIVEPGPIHLSPTARETGPRRQYRLYIALGHTKEDVDAQLDALTRQGFDTALEETRAWWRDRLHAPQIIQRLPGAAPLLRKSLQDLLLCVNPHTGAALEAPLASDPFPRAHPRDAVWIIEALHRADTPQPAAGLATFLLRALAPNPNAPQHQGTLPTALHSDGSPAMPPGLIDTAATAWALLAAAQHIARLDPAERGTFLHPHHDALLAARSFLAGWRMADGIPAPAYDPSLGRDSVGENLFFELWLGLAAADRLSTAAALPPSETARNRQEELLTRMKFERINRGVPLAIPFNTAYWLYRFAPEQRDLWNRLIAVVAHGITPEGPAWRLDDLLGAQTITALPEARRAAQRILAVSDQLE
jgi:hypothetical protein